MPATATMQPSSTLVSADTSNLDHNGYLIVMMTLVLVEIAAWLDIHYSTLLQVL